MTRSTFQRPADRWSASARRAWTSLNATRDEERAFVRREAVRGVRPTPRLRADHLRRRARAHGAAIAGVVPVRVGPAVALGECGDGGLGRRIAAPLRDAVAGRRGRVRAQERRRAIDQERLAASLLDGGHRGNGDHRSQTGGEADRRGRGCPGGGVRGRAAAQLLAACPARGDGARQPQEPAPAPAAVLDPVREQRREQNADQRQLGRSAQRARHHERRHRDEQQQRQILGHDPPVVARVVTRLGARAAASLAAISSAPA